MFELLRSLLQPRDLDTAGPIPPVCYDECSKLKFLDHDFEGGGTDIPSTSDNAYLVAQNTNLTAAFCEDGSSFKYYYRACDECVIANTEGQQRVWAEGNLTQIFTPYFDYCYGSPSYPATTQSPASSTTNIPASWLTISAIFVRTTWTGVLLTGSATITTTVYESVNITSTLPAYFFHVDASSLISKFIPTDVFSQLAASVASAATAASVTGAYDPTSLIYSALEDTSMPSWFQSAVPVTYSTQISTLDAQINNLRADLLGSTVGPTSSAVNGTTSSSSTSRAWIAGAVIGPVAGISLILLGMFLLRRRRLRKHGTPHESDIKTNDKPELHADSLPAPRVYEMDGMQHSIELEVSETPQELPAERPTKTPS